VPVRAVQPQHLPFTRRAKANVDIVHEQYFRIAIG
jgi:hypothetical protein